MKNTGDALIRISGSVLKLRTYLTRRGAELTPPEFKVVKRAPTDSYWKGFPRKLVRNPQDVSVSDVPETTSVPLKRLMTKLMATVEKAKKLDTQITVEKAKIDKKYGEDKAKLKKETAQKVLAVWRLLNKNRGLIGPGVEVFERVKDAYLLGARGPSISEPMPMEPDPRVDDALAFIAERVPGLYEEFEAIINKIEQEYLDAQDLESRTSKPEMLVYDLTKISSVRTSGVVDTIMNALVGTFRKFKSWFRDAHHVLGVLDKILQG